MPSFLGCQCWYSFDDKTHSPGAEDILARGVHADLFCLFVFGNLEGTDP